MEIQPNPQWKFISFYVCAHPDDWQLFMFPDAYHDLHGCPKTVFIHISAGEAGLGRDFWLAREEGSKSSIRMVMAPVSPLAESDADPKPTILGHRIYRWSVMNRINEAVCYFLRLPDGNSDGGGFELYGNQSLCKLMQGSISSITAVDHAATYTGWTDLCDTIKAIIQMESAGFNEKRVKTHDPDPLNNPKSHPDHQITGEAVLALDIPEISKAWFVDYHLADLPANLAGPDLFWKIAMFAAYDKAVYDGCHYSTINESPQYLEWCLRGAKFRIT